jgi:hypothetical protein
VEPVSPEPVLPTALELALSAAASCDIYFLRRAPDSRSSAAQEERASLADATIPGSELNPDSVVDAPYYCCDCYCGHRCDRYFDRCCERYFDLPPYRFDCSSIPEPASQVADASAVPVAASAPASEIAVSDALPESAPDDSPLAPADFVPVLAVPFAVDQRVAEQPAES